MKINRTHHFDFNKKVTLVTVAVGVAVILMGIILKFAFKADEALVCFVPFLDNLHRIGSENGLTLYLSQLSFTFITISVMSVLSDSSVVIYWENMVKKKLIEPVWSCFHAYTTYSFATVLFGGIAALIGLPLISLGFFVVDIFVLMALTFSMIDVYFKHDEKALKLEKEFRELVIAKEEPNEVPQDVLKHDYEKYLRITGKLRTNTILALRAYDSSTIEENFNFYARNAQYIPRRDFETIMKCVDEINIYDYIEWFDYFTSVSYMDGTMPKCQSQFYIENIMCKNKDLFYFLFDKNVLPVVARYSDSVSGERMFCAYKEYMKKQRDALKKSLADRYDRRSDSPAASISRGLLLEALLEVFKNGNRDFLLSFLHAFEETNILSNYDYNENDVYMWEKFFESFSEEEAGDVLYDIYPITEIMYGMRQPECVKEAARNVFGSLGDTAVGYTKAESYSSEYDEEYMDECEDDSWEYYCKVYGQEYVGWPPENDKSGIFTYAGQMAYHMSSQHGEMQDGDLKYE